ncbi:hypothetical protein AAY84_17505 [Serratia marcescens]|nr:hypothetical protein AAY84_17505 [Serratia marcescens]
MHPAVMCAPTLGRLVSDELLHGVNPAIPHGYRPARFIDDGGEGVDIIAIAGRFSLDTAQPPLVVFCAVGEALIYLLACLRQVRHEAVAVQAAASTTVNPFAKRLRDGAFGRDSRQTFLWRPKAEQLLTGHEDTYHA